MKTVAEKKNSLFYDTHFAFNDEEIRERKLQ